MTYAVNSGSSEVYGTNEKTAFHNSSFNLRSGYTLKGFRLDGSFLHMSTTATLPTFFAENNTPSSQSGSNSYGVSATHRLPWSGTFFAGWNRYTYDTELVSSNYRASTDTVTTQATLNPLRRLSVSVGSNYSSNVFAVLDQQLISAGGLPAYTGEARRAPCAFTATPTTWSFAISACRGTSTTTGRRSPARATRRRNMAAA